MKFISKVLDIETLYEADTIQLTVPALKRAVLKIGEWLLWSSALCKKIREFSKITRQNLHERTENRINKLPKIQNQTTY